MLETRKFDKWIGILSISVICIVAIVFIVMISDTHLAKGTYGVNTDGCDLYLSDVCYKCPSGMSKNGSALIPSAYKVSGWSCSNGWSALYEVMDGGYCIYEYTSGEATPATAKHSCDNKGGIISGQTSSGAYICRSQSPCLAKPQAITRHCYIDNNTHKYYLSGTKNSANDSEASNFTDANCPVGGCASGYSPSGDGCVSSLTSSSTSCDKDHCSKCGLSECENHGCSLYNGSCVTKCAAGTYFSQAANTCVNCGIGYYCNGGNSRTKCPDGTTTSGTQSKTAADCIADSSAAPTCDASQGLYKNVGACEAAAASEDVGCKANENFSCDKVGDCWKLNCVARLSPNSGYRTVTLMRAEGTSNNGSFVVDKGNNQITSFNAITNCGTWSTTPCANGNCNTGASAQNASYSNLGVGKTYTGPDILYCYAGTSIHPSGSVNPSSSSVKASSSSVKASSSSSAKASSSSSAKASSSSVKVNSSADTFTRDINGNRCWHNKTAGTYKIVYVKSCQSYDKFGDAALCTTKDDGNVLMNELKDAANAGCASPASNSADTFTRDINGERCWHNKATGTYKIVYVKSCQSKDVYGDAASCTTKNDGYVLLSELRDATNAGCAVSNSTSSVPSNPQTGTAGIIFAWVIGLFAIGYSFWYFKRTSTN